MPGLGVEHLERCLVFTMVSLEVMGVEEKRATICCIPQVLVPIWGGEGPIVSPAVCLSRLRAVSNIAFFSLKYRFLHCVY